MAMIPHSYDIGQSCGEEEEEDEGHVGNETTGQLKLCNPKTIQESHEKEIYCIAWSKDVHQQHPKTKTTTTTNTRCAGILQDDDDDDEYDDIDDDDFDQNRIAFSVSINDKNENASSVDQDDSSRRIQEPPLLLYRYMATCAGRHVCVYQVPIIVKTNKEEQQQQQQYCPSSSMDDDDAAPELEMIQSYMDSDVNEEFYSCVFAGRSNHEFAAIRRTTASSRSNDQNHSQYFTGETSTGPQLLCAAGMGRSIKVIDTVRQELVATLQGHGNHIYDLKLSPTNDFLLLSASKDRSIRLWNLESGSLVAVFAGHHKNAAHCDDIVSISWHVTGHRFVSSGTDRKILIWNVGPGTQVYHAVQRSHQVARRLFEQGQRDHEKPVQCFFPIFATCTFDYSHYVTNIEPAQSMHKKLTHVSAFFCQ
jgi:WD domain, G-beta repeat